MSVETEDAPTKTIADSHAQALERFELAASAVQDQQDREEDDLRFQVPELQWPDEAKQQRLGGKIGNVPLPPRPMLSIPKLDQPIQLEINKEKAAHLGVNIHPLSENADDKTAEKLQEIYRRIEVDSKAHLARSWAFERAVKCGRGFYRILTEYDPAAPKGSKDQRIRIKRLLHQESAYLDPFAEEPDGSDADYGFIWQWVPFDRYKRTPEYKKRKNADGTEDTLELYGYDGGLLDTLMVSKPAWVKGSGESRLVLVVEYFSVEYDDEGNRSVTWRKLNAVEIIDEKPWPGQYVPIIPVIGRELIPFDSDRRYVGIIGPNKDSQRFFNYNASSVAETVGQEPKATWMMAEGQEEGHEQEFLLANVRNFPYLRYKLKMLDGQLAPPPQRVQADTSKLGLGIQALAMANEFIHAGTFKFEPSLGKQSPNVKTKGATLALQQQGDESNSNWLDNLAQISMPHEACVVLDMMCGDPKTGRVGIYDRKGRIVRTLDAEDNHGRVMLNQPYVSQQGKIIPVDPNRPPQGVNPDDIEHYDLTAGAQYMVSVNIGKAYPSRLAEGNEGLGQLFQAEPELFKILGDLWLNFQTWPGHQAAADRMKKLLPPQLQDEDGQGDPKMELQQAKAALQQMQQQMQAMAKALETDQVKVQGNIEKAKIDGRTSVALQQMKDATSIAVAQIAAMTKGVQMATEARNEAMATGQEQAHEATQNAMDRQHELNRIMLEHQTALQQAAQGHQQAMEQGAVGTAQDAALADQAAGHASDAAVQQAALQPPPDSGAEA